MNWDIKGCSGKCVRCDKIFEDGDLYQCRLIMEENGPRREDYCIPCWQKIDNDPAKSYSVWQGRHIVEIGPVEEPITEPILKHLLKKWIHSKERLHQCFCYILALMLERKKKFSPRPEVDGPDGRKCLVYEDRHSGEDYIIEDPGFSLKELDRVEGQLQDMLEKELGSSNAPEAPDKG